jgi:hypothetical protein
VKYDSTLPVAVFLGPSLDPAAARSILPANYYPPVRMGDVYRLLTCGVRTIVIIDGVFHNTAPVWQREILAALLNGISVVGASSMGALRAVELAPWGMVGVGTVCEWYQSGRIAGDDEVALLHGEAEFGYRAMSEALVNIRFTLERAVRAGALTPDQGTALVHAMAALDHGSRSYPALFACDAFGRLSATAQDDVRALVADGSESLKQRDARQALEWVASNLARLAAGPTGARIPKRRIERPEEVLMRGVPGEDDELTPLRELLVEAAADIPRVTAIVRAAARRCFLLDWMRQRDVRLPQQIDERFFTEWLQDHGVVDLRTWLAANAITEVELRRELADRAAEAWLLSQEPPAFGLTKPFLEAWAEAAGVEPPTDPAASFSDRLLDFGPAFFGFDQFGADIVFARELQVTGEIARLAQRELENADARAL